MLEGSTEERRQALTSRKIPLTSQVCQATDQELQQRLLSRSQGPRPGGPPEDYNTGGPLSCCFHLPRVTVHCCETPRERKLPEARIQEPSLACLPVTPAWVEQKNSFLTRWLMYFSR